jgi:uncharacterized membrane protein YbaN (DUF454 family)
VKRRIRLIGGFTLIGLGVLGTLLPIIPGVPLVFAGLALVGSDHPAIRRLRERLNRWRHRRKGSR